MTGSSEGWPTRWQRATAPLDAETRLLELAADVVERTNVDPEQLAPLVAAEVGGTESTVVYEENKLELHRYSPETVEHETPILVVYALVNRPYILDLQPDRSVVRQLLDAGFEVYLIEWGEPSRLDTDLGLDDYVCRYLDNCVSAACADAGVDSVHLLGYCMGGTLSVIYAALFGDRVRSLGLMATPVAIDGTGGTLEEWLTGYDPAVVTETFGNAPSEFLALQFSLLEPVENYVTKYVRLTENVDDESFVAMFGRMERWTWDGVDVAGRAYREFVTEVYDRNALIDGSLSVGGREVDLTAIDIPLLQIVGAGDHIVPPAASAPLNDAVGTDDERLIEFPAGHIGISVSGRAHEELWPTVCDWYAARSD